MSTESPGNWSQLDLHRLVGEAFRHPIVTEETRIVCENDVIRIEQNRVRNMALEEAGDAIRAVGASDSCYEAVVVPELVDGRLLLVGRYRYATDRWSVEFPRFAAQSSDEGWKHTAEVILSRDYGLASAKMSLLGAFHADAATLAVNTIVVLAAGCTQQKPLAFDPRVLVAGTVGAGPDELSHMLRQGEITCGVSLAALALYEVHKRR
ncbi:MAG: hypothetical protein WD845_01125 [Pirellulales bacterium]